MKRAFDEILQECIRELEASGGDSEAVLRRHPKEAAELRPHLEVWASLSGLKKSEASPQGMAQGRQQLLRSIAIGEQPKEVTKVMQNLPAAGRVSLRIFAPLVAGAALALGVAFLAGALDFSSHSSTAEAGPIQDCLLQLDFNHDGKLSVLDVVAFRDAIKSQDPAFDLNGDTVVDVFDAVFAVKQVILCIQQIQPPPVP